MYTLNTERERERERESVSECSFFLKNPGVNVLLQKGTKEGKGVEGNTQEDIG